jgi:hypothetical protein
LTGKVRFRRFSRWFLGRGRLALGPARRVASIGMGLLLAVEFLE